LNQARAEQDGSLNNGKKRCGHEPVGDLVEGPTLMSSPIFWAVIVVAVVVAIAIPVAKRRAARKATAEAARALAELRGVAAECRISGHVYQEYDTGWRCATCGNHVPRKDGELYGLVTDGKHERRRNPR